MLSFILTSPLAALRDLKEIEVLSGIIMNSHQEYDHEYFNLNYAPPIFDFEKQIHLLSKLVKTYAAF